MSAIETLDIIALGDRGEGIARTDVGAVFVPFTAPGDRVRATRDGARGELVEIVSPGPDRIAAFCPHFGACGGCQVQHIAAPAYRAWKRELVVHALERAGIDAEVGSMVDAHGAGRRRATLHGVPGKAGFMALRSHDIHDLDRCPILVPALAAAPDITRAFAAALGPCDVALTATPLGLDVSITAKAPRSSAKLPDLARRFDLARIALNGELMVNQRSPHVTIETVDVPLPIASFLQATELAETVLGDMVRDAAKGAKAVADLFCGIGPFTFRLATIAAVFAADSDASAIDALRMGVRKAKKLKPITAEKRNLFTDPLTRFELGRFDVVVFDPPRAGAKAQAQSLAGAKVPKIIAVSCDPKSFARDAAILIEGGYRLGTVTPVDQFAYSAHVEVVATFTR
jgi:23S rRNA (uracil1939-C5)-methyltransferase